MTTQTEKKVVAGLWGILIIYIGFSSIMMWGNRVSLAVIEERINSFVVRMDKVESLRFVMDATKADCVERAAILRSEIEELKRHSAANSAWRCRIEERLADVVKRLDNLPPHELMERVKELEEWRRERK